jgi:hypothetical protein
MSYGFNPFSYIGAVLLDANGASKVKGLATGFKALNYDVCAVADGDAPIQFSPKDADDLEKKAIEVLMWSEQLALEQRAMLDLPWSSVLASVKLAQDLGLPVHDNVRSKLAVMLDPDVMNWMESGDLRKAIGNAAKSSAWFKSISGGESWVEVITPALDDAAFKKRDLGTKLSQLRAWLDHG